MTKKRTLAIIGASLAGAKAAEGARDAGYDGRIVLVGEESALPYERPPLSKGVLRGEEDVESARVHAESFYLDHDIELVTDEAVAFDTSDRTVELANGGTISFDTAVFATGASPRRLDVPGTDLSGVHYLRTSADAVRLRDAIKTAHRVAVIGAGWIGSEVAASARQMGADVVVIDPASVPLRLLLGDEIGGVFRRLHEDNGVQLRLGATATELSGTKSVERVMLDDGSEEAADVVVIGIGVVPRTDLASAAAGLRIDDGIVVDEHLATNIDGVYAAGDVANAMHPRYHRHLRVEHWANALNQGLAAGRNAAGENGTYSRLPYFFSDQYDLGMEYLGVRSPDDALAVRGDLGTREFVAIWHRDGQVTAAMNVNVWDVVDDLRALIDSPKPVDPAALADPGTALDSLV